MAVFVNWTTREKKRELTELFNVLIMNSLDNYGLLRMIVYYVYLGRGNICCVWYLCVLLNLTMYGEFLSKHSKGLVNYELFLIFDLISNWVFTVLWEISMQVLSTIKTSSLLLLMQSTYFRVPPLRLISESLFGSEPGNTIHCILLSADV